MAEFTGNATYCCRNCRNQIVFGEDLLSKSFKAQSGPAYMFAQAMNVALGPKEDKELMTGLYAICEVYCRNCGEVVGWKYLRSYDPRQRYKEGRFVIEKAKILKEYS
ncbi:hypothetical protein NMG60_11017964 [Bertholletia excelsa]